MSDASINAPLSHDAAYAELGSLALGALSADDARLVRAHVADCSICATKLEEMERVAVVMPSRTRAGVLSPARSAAIRSRLVARAGESRGVGKPARNYSRLLAIAAAVLLIALSVGYYRENAARQQLVVSTARRDSVVAALNAIVRERDAELAAVTGPSVSVVDLSSTGIHPPTARMFWDKATNRWTLFAHGLAAPKPGRTYELWLVTADKKIPAGIFKPAEDGSAVVRATYALQPGDLKAIAITEEPEGGVPAPTGAVILAGTRS